MGNPLWAIFVASALFPEDGVHRGNQLSTRVAATKQWPAKVVTERTIMATSLISNLYTEPKDLETNHSTHSLAELYVIPNEQFSSQAPSVQGSINLSSG